ncbi:MAG TPA: pseudouridine synthase [Candidatus Saccharimonadales bacterium]|nr:pseudouridine synthase [Candidatus Saccharimonadales bacterium]
MRINKFVAQASGLSRRAADTAIEQGRVLVDGRPPIPGQQITDTQKITLDGQRLHAQTTHRTILLNKPAGFVVSRNGQGSKTIYDLLPAELHSLKPIGRLDKESSGLLLLTDDGLLAHELTHPRFAKQKIYEVELDNPLRPLHRQMISDQGIQLEDGPSKLQLERLEEGNDIAWRVTMHEGRNRQIRRTFAALGYEVKKLHRTHFGAFVLPPGLTSGAYQRHHEAKK